MSTASADTSLAVAVDIGGTFTDIALLDPRAARSGAPRRRACRPIPSQAFITGMRLALDDAGRAAPALGRVLHGTTVATNMILEGKGARTALVTTAGFRHVLEIGRQDIPRRANYSRLGEAAAPGAGLARVRGRASASAPAARCIEPLDEASVRRPRPRPAARMKVEAVAVCLLHTFANPAHERRVAELLRAELPGIAVTVSADVLPVVREYERSLATVLNAAVMPGVSTYVSRLEERLAEERSRRRCCSCSRTAASPAAPPSAARRR